MLTSNTIIKTIGSYASFGTGSGFWYAAKEQGPGGVTDGLQLWFNSSDSSNLNIISGRVTSWLSSGGQNVSLTSTSGDEPYYIDNVLNGMPVIRGLGAEFMTVNMVSFIPKQFFVVAKHNNINTSEWIFSFGSTQNDLSLVSSTFNDEGYILETNNSAQQIKQNTTILPQEEFNIIAGEVNSSASQLQFNTSIIANGTLNNISSSRMNLFRSYDGTGVGRYDIAEIIVYNRVLDHNEQNIIEMYLLNKYFPGALYDKLDILLDFNYNLLTN